MLKKIMVISCATILGMMPSAVYADDIALSVRTEGSAKDLGIEITGARIDADNIRHFYPKEGQAYTVTKTNVRDKAEGIILQTLEAGAEVMIKGYDGDWAETDQGYIYAGLLASRYKEKRQIHAYDMESLKYEGLAYRYMENLPGVLETLAETTPITLKASKDAIKERDSSFTDFTSGYTESYSDHSEITVWANTVYMEDSLLHELGHVLDHNVLSAGQYSNTKEWEIAYQDEAQEVYEKLSGSRHNCGNSEEYFAEAVKLYVLDNGQLKECAPDTYKIMEQLLTDKE